MKNLFLPCLLLLLCAQCFGMTVVNSLDGRDLVSGVYYSAVRHDAIVFAMPGDAAQAVYDQVGTGKSILLIQSADHPIITGLADGLTNKGNTVQTIQSTDPLKTNLDLAQKSGATKFVVVDPVYGYNTVSALAYAKLNGMYLLFADKTNSDQVAAFIKGANAGDVLIYGYSDQEVKASFANAGLSYREINNGDKFDDNMQLDDLYFAQNPSKKQVMLSDGNAFDATTAAGEDPVVLISPVIPVSVYQYIKAKVSSGQVSVAMLVDQEYAQTAYDLKTSINNELGTKALTVLVKIGEATAGTTGLSQVGLFPLPGPALGLSVDTVEYDTQKQALEVTYDNTGNALEYVKSSILVFADGAYVATVGDDQPFALGKGKKVGVSYPVKIDNGAVSANITSYFGSSKKSQETGIQVLLSAGRVQFTDASLLDITAFNRDQATDDLFVTFSNTGNVTDYFTAGATIVANGTSTSISDDNTYKLAPGEGKMIKFPGIAKSGSKITATADYGAREAFLSKNVKKEYVPEAQAAAAGGDILPLLAGAVFVILVVAGVLFFLRGKGKDNKK
jgi:hypothetical protein